MAFFNALILERRKFGAVGWNIPYEWMNSDLKTAIMQVRSSSSSSSSSTSLLLVVIVVVVLCKLDVKVP